MDLHDETVEIAVGGQHIEGTLLRPAARRRRVPGVLFVHGWGGHRDQYANRAAMVASLGCICLTFDLRGHQRTRPQHETVTREDGVQDVLAAYDLLAGQAGVDIERMAVVGSSYGAYLGAIVTTQRPVLWLSLRAPALYKDEGWDLPKRRLHEDPGFAAYRHRRHPPHDNRALLACSAFRGHALVIESRHDAVVPHPVISSYVAALADAHSLTYRVIDEADHGLSNEEWQKAYTRLLVAWVKEMTAPARGEPQEQPQAVAAAAAAAGAAEDR